MRSNVKGTHIFDILFNFCPQEVLKITLFRVKQKGLLLDQSNSPYLVRVLRFELRAS